MTTTQIANLLGLDCNEVATIISDTGIGADIVEDAIPHFSDYFAEMCDQTCYKPILPLLNYGERLVAVEKQGTNEVDKRYASLLADTQGDYKKLTELTLVLNWLSWYHYDCTNDMGLSSHYARLFEECDNFAFDTLHGEELDYFIRTLD